MTKGQTLNQTLTVDKPALLLAFLFEQFAESKKTRVRQLLKHGCVSVGGRVTTQFDYALQGGDKIRIETLKTRAAAGGLQILYEDHDLIAISKPTGLLSIATDKIQGDTAISTVNDYINKKAGKKSRHTRYQKSVFIVHRLDRDVSGVMVLAKNEDAKRCLQKNWGQVTKEYSAVVEGRPAKSPGTLVSYLSEDKTLRITSGPRRPGARKADIMREKEALYAKADFFGNRRHARFPA